MRNRFEDQPTSSIMDNIQRIPGLVENWSFEPSTIERWERRYAIETFFKHAHRQPKHKQIKGIAAQRTWVVFFIFAPEGKITSAHRFTLQNLRKSGLPILVICATPSADSIPTEISESCDALIWKDLSGYDFSAYTIALEAISRSSPGADVFVMNDSVFGPFSDLREFIRRAPWDLTGFTASNQLTSHIQSYAFILKKVDRSRLLKMRSVFFPYFSISAANAVIHLQETRFARVAARHMTVGAFWYGDCKAVIDPTLVRPFALLDAGFPFLKRSLLGKNKSFVEEADVHAHLERFGHPKVDHSEGTPKKG